VTNLNLRILARVFGRPATLRADVIRRDTLTQLAAALREDHTSEVQNALDALVDAMGHDLRDGEIDKLVADIESVTHMDAAQMDLTDADVQQLATEAALAAQVAAGSVVALPQQQDRRAS
jgi:hypothetical protein